MEYLIVRNVTLAVIMLLSLAFVLIGEWYDNYVNGGDENDARG